MLFLVLRVSQHDARWTGSSKLVVSLIWGPTGLIKESTASATAPTFLAVIFTPVASIVTAASATAMKALACKFKTRLMPKANFVAAREVESNGSTRLVAVVTVSDLPPPNWALATKVRLGVLWRSFRQSEHLQGQQRVIGNALPHLPFAGPNSSSGALGKNQTQSTVAFVQQSGHLARPAFRNSIRNL